VRDRRRGLAALAAIVLLAAACSTGGGKGVDVSAMLRDARTTTTKAGGAIAAAGGSPARVAGGPRQGGAGHTGSAAAGPGEPAGASPGSTGGAGELPPASAPSTGGTVRIGIHYSEDLQAAYAAFGAKGAEPDPVEAIQKVVDWINGHGGMGGHQVEPLFHGSDPLDGSFDALAQKACEDFAERGAAAVVSGAVLPTIVTPDCLSKRGIPLVWNYHYLLDEPAWQRYRANLYMPFSMTAERLGPAYVDGLAAGKWFDRAKVGIVRYDNPQHERFSRAILRPALAARDVNVVEEVALSQPPSAAAAGDTGAQIANAIVRLRRAGATHVLFVPSGGAVPFIFMNEAEGQGYRPRYAMTTLDIPYFVNDQATPSQLHGALAVGWSPASDVYREQEPPSPPRQLCYQLTDSRASQRFCDGLFFLKQAFDAAGRTDPDSLRTAVEGLGTGFDPVFSLRTSFRPGRHDGASVSRLVAFDDGCECFNYTGGLRPVP
jgi:hypothetical protein